MANTGPFCFLSLTRTGSWRVGLADRVKRTVFWYLRFLTTTYRCKLRVISYSCLSVNLSGLYRTKTQTEVITGQGSLHPVHCSFLSMELTTQDSSSNHTSGVITVSSFTLSSSSTEAEIQHLEQLSLAVSLGKWTKSLCSPIINQLQVIKEWLRLLMQYTHRSTKKDREKKRQTMNLHSVVNACDFTPPDR